MHIDLLAAEDAAKTLYIRALKSLPPDIKEGLATLERAESMPGAREILRTMTTNIAVA